MTSRRHMKPYGFLVVITLATIAELAVAGVDQAYVKRGTVERQGRTWIERSDCSAPVRDGGRLVLRADFGSVTVATGAGDRMECQVVLRSYTSKEALARRQFGSFDLTVRLLEGGGVYVNGRSAGEHWRSSSLSAAYNIRVPQRFNLDIETQGGDVTVEDPLQGELHGTTAGGEITASDVTGPVKVETAGGNITLWNIGRHLEARTAGGNILLGSVKGSAVLETSGGEIGTGQIEGSLRAETAGGDVVIERATGAVVAQTSGGQIRIGPSGGAVRAQTAGGSIRLQGARGRVEVETAGGSIDLYRMQGAIKASTAQGRILAQIDADRRTFAASELETSMGDVQVYLPASLPLTIDAAIEMAAGHRILSDFPLNIQGEDQEFDQREIRGHGALNGGGQVLRIRTVNGNIEIRKIDSRTIEQLKMREESDLFRGHARRIERERLKREKEKQRRQLLRFPD